MSDRIKLNLGYGQNLLPGFINVDKFGEPELVVNLGKFPWPWEDGSMEPIELNHVLEHLGKTVQTCFKAIQALYRVCVTNADIHRGVPHTRQTH